MTLDNWQDSNYLIVQNPSALVSGADKLGLNLITYNGLVPSNDTYLSYRPIDNSVRVPASKSYMYAYANMLTSSGRVSNYRLGQGFYGNLMSSSSIFTDTTILDKAPRMYVQLQKLADFIADIGINNQFAAKALFNSYDVSYTYGYNFIRTENIPDNAYVLRAYSIYTNNNDGNEQTLLASYDYATTTQVTVYDTFIPCKSYGTLTDSGATFIAYMRSLLPHLAVNSTSLSRYWGSLPLYVGIDGKISGGKISGAVNMFAVSGGEDFDPVPFMTTSSVYPAYYAKLTSAPLGDYVTYIAADLATWKKLLTASGMPWSDNLDDIISPGDEDLNKPTTPGQPDNPVDDDDGDGDNISDDIDYPVLDYIPNSTVYDRYFLTPNQIVDIKKFLFSDTFIDNIKRIWTNPADYVISLAYYPFDVDDTDIVTTDTLVSIGGITSDVSALAATDSGIPYFYGGAVRVGNYYNSYLDYEPYTSIDIYIPYIGVRPLNVSQIVGHTLCIGYYIDFNTQQITALIGLDGNADNLGHVVTQYIGSIGVQTPLSGTSAQEVTSNIVQQTTGLITGIGAIAGGVSTANVAMAAGGAANTASALLGGGHTSPNYYGALSPISGLLTPQTAYLIINRPITAEPEKFKDLAGYSSCYSSSGGLGAFSGYLKCAFVDIPAATTMTAEEQQEIKDLFLGGIYVG